METLADFNLDRKYHPRKENVVVDASSRKTVVVAALIALEWKLWEQLDLNIEKRGHITNLIARPIIMQRIAEVQDEDKKLVKIKANIEVRKDFKIFKDGTLTYHGRLCVPSIKELREEILKEAHGTKYTTHLGSTKM